MHTHHADTTAAYFAGVQYGSVACASAQIAIKPFLQSLWCCLLTLLLTLGESLMGCHNESRSTEATL